MVDIWHEYASFQITGQRLADQLRNIIKKDSFSDLEILEKHQKINNEQDSNTVQSTSENRNATNPNKSPPNNKEQTLTQEQKVNQENFKRIKNGEKNTLPSPRNIEWRTGKTETKNINQVLTYISTNNIIKLNELMYAGAKLVREKIRINWKSTKEKWKPGWEIWLETQMKKKNTKTDQNDKIKERHRNM